MGKFAILFVCHANICRSPMAEGILRKLLVERGFGKQVRVDSAGTHAAVFSSRPDARAQRVMISKGIDIRQARSRRIRRKDFERFSHILAMDRSNLEHLEELCPEDTRYKLALVLKFGTNSGLKDVPDPYYGNEQGFEVVYEMLQPSIASFLNDVLLNDTPQNYI